MNVQLARAQSVEKLDPVWSRIVGEAGGTISGYWIGHKLYCGKYLEVDNFVVDDAHRSSGVGEHLLNWMTEEAKREGCELMMLDAYVENFKAHRFYYRQGFHARGFHYLRKS